MPGTKSAAGRVGGVGRIVNMTMPPVGIDFMVMVGGGVRITAKELAAGISISEMGRKVHEVVEMNRPTIRDKDQLETALGRIRGGLSTIKQFKAEKRPEEKLDEDEPRYAYMSRKLREANEDIEKGRTVVGDSEMRLRDILELLHDSFSVDTTAILKGKSPEEIASIALGLLDEITTMGPGVKAQVRDAIVELTAKEKMMDPNRITGGHGIYEIRLPAPSQGNMTLLADALYKFFKRITENPQDLAKLREYPIKFIPVGCESNPDASLPVYMLAAKMALSKLLKEDPKFYGPVVDELRRTMAIELKFACVSGMVGLDLATHVVTSRYMRGEKCSALVCAVDTAIYDEKRAPGASVTQGSGAGVVWVTPDPALIELSNDVTSESYNMPLQDFTKWGESTAYVHGLLSLREYIYLAGVAYQNLEKKLIDIGKKSDMAESHPAFPKLIEYLAVPLFLHDMRFGNNYVLHDIEARIGAEPRPNGKNILEMIDVVLKRFNANGTLEKEHLLIKNLETDQDIGTWWKWADGVRKQEEFKDWIDKQHIKRKTVAKEENPHKGTALEAASTWGNTYALQKLLADAVTLKNLADVLRGKIVTDIGYGSGGEAIAIQETYVATQEVADERVIIAQDAVEITAAQYVELHPLLLMGEAKRFAPGADNLERTKVLLRGEMPRGFHIRFIESDTSIEGVHVNGGGEPVDVQVRHMADLTEPVHMEMGSAGGK